MPWIAAVLSVTDDHAGTVGHRDEFAKLREIELPIRIGEEDVVEAGGAKACPDRRAVAPVLRVPDQPNPRIGGRDLLDRFRRAIAAPVVDDDHLDGIGELRRDAAGGLDAGGDVGLLVIGREDDRDPGETA